jgi:DNA-binding NarL/FixJ family response regulator
MASKSQSYKDSGFPITPIELPNTHIYIRETHWEMVQMIIQGMSYLEISETLNKNRRVISEILNKIYKRAGVNTRERFQAGILMGKIKLTKVDYLL